MIPWGVTVSVGWWNRTGRRQQLWLWVPLFLVWLVLLPLMLVLFPLVAVACVFLRLNAFRLYGTAWQILRSLRRTLVEVESPDVSVRVHMV